MKEDAVFVRASKRVRERAVAENRRAFLFTYWRGTPPDLAAAAGAHGFTTHEAMDVLVPYGR